MFLCFKTMFVCISSHEVNVILSFKIHISFVLGTPLVQGHCLISNLQATDTHTCLYEITRQISSQRPNCQSNLFLIGFCKQLRRLLLFFRQVDQNHCRKFGLSSKPLPSLSYLNYQDYPTATKKTITQLCNIPHLKHNLYLALTIKVSTFL